VSKSKNTGINHSVDRGLLTWTRNMLGILLMAAMAPLAAKPNGAVDNSVAPIVVETANITSVEQVLQRTEAKRLVFVGETHTSLSDHQLQLQVLKVMHEQGGDLAIGVEWFQRPFQPVLDRYIEGDIGESEFLRKSEYFQRWGFDYRLYRDILRYAQEHGIRVLALNASREITQAIREKGLDGLAKEQRGRLPQSYDFDNAKYAEHLRKIFQIHKGRNQEDPEAFRRFLEVQLTWDETMASGVAEYLAASEDRRVLVFAGKGHTHAAAIPGRVARRNGIKGLSIASYQPGEAFEQPDFLVLQPSQYLPPAGLIGVTLEEKENGVHITSISKGSLAGKAGIKAGDRLLAIGDVPIVSYTDVKLAMLDRLPGDTLAVKVHRSGLFGIETEVEAEVTLIAQRLLPH